MVQSGTTQNPWPLTLTAGLFTLLFVVTGFFTMTVMGHATGALDVIAFFSSVAGVPLAWLLRRHLARTTMGALLLAVILLAVAVVPIWVTVEIIRAIRQQ